MRRWLVCRILPKPSDQGQQYLSGLAPKGFVQWDTTATLLMATPRTSKPGCVGHGRASANGTTPYAPCLVSPTSLPGNLLHTNLPTAAQEICTRAGLFRLV